MPKLAPVPSLSADQPSPPAPAQHKNLNFRISIDWQPGKQFPELLSFAGLPANYSWQDELPEFVLYRLGQSEQLSQGAWEHRFIQTLKRNTVHRSLRGNDPAPLPNDWRPSNECVTALMRNGISQRFLDNELFNFAIFWRDAGTPHRSWNAKFIDYVKNAWRNQPQEQASAFDRLTDTNWAAGLVPGIAHGSSDAAQLN